MVNILAGTCHDVNSIVKRSYAVFYVHVLLYENFFILLESKI